MIAITSNMPYSDYTLYSVVISTVMDILCKLGLAIVRVLQQFLPKPEESEPAVTRRNGACISCRTNQSLT
jgi:hypothetical protein